MIIKNADLHRQTVSSPKGGAGEMDKLVLVPDGENAHVKRMVHLTLKPGCRMGRHLHEDDSEFYFILSGRGSYDDNGTVSEVNPGDLCVVRPGESHSLANAGDTDLSVLALILPD